MNYIYFSYHILFIWYIFKKYGLFYKIMFVIKSIFEFERLWKQVNCHQFFLYICTVAISQLVFLFILITFSNMLTPSELTEYGNLSNFLVSVIIQVPFFNWVHFYVIDVTRSSLKHVEQAITRSASDQSALRKSLFNISKWGWYKGFSNTLYFWILMVFSYNYFNFLDLSNNSGFNS